jgi:extracellular factor (EF) 3-hydroxypalmitic acid methyl ester biosynthesis protein
MTTLTPVHDSVRDEIPRWFDSLLDAFSSAVSELVTEVEKLDAPFSQERLGDAANVVQRRLDGQFAALSAGLRHLDVDELAAAVARCRGLVGPIFDRSELLARLFSKPLGYAGDYEMMNMIYAEHTAGSDLLGQALGRYAVAMPEACAVRNRVAYLGDKIVAAADKATSERPARILSVAAGPALEIQALLAVHDGLLERSHFVLLDQDPRALAHARRQINAVTSDASNVEYLRCDIREVIKHGLEQPRFDLIYSAGLFDYFSDRTARAAAARLAESLALGGSLVIGNFGPGGPSRALMELVLDWHLTYRSADRLKELYSTLGHPVHIEAEPSGINLFAIINGLAEVTH